ncbi:MAG: VWA domain-containing protein [Clostridia bacterium]|nr:VWA domain-containing protein [Clostridia bacterium]
MKKRRPTSAKLAALALRCTAVLLIAASIAGIAVNSVSDKKSVMIVADLSDSAKGHREAYAEYVKTAVKSLTPDTELGLVTFGYNSNLELPLSLSPEFSDFGTIPAGNYTDIYSALIKAAALMPSGSAKRIILLTDGKENIGRVKSAAAALAAQKIRLDAIVTETGTAEGEIQLTDISVPDVLYAGESFNVVVTVESASAAKAVLTLKNEGFETRGTEVDLRPGTNRFVFRETADSTGITSYTAEISSVNDAMTKNNRIYTFINVLGKPKVLVIDGTGSDAHELPGIIGDSALLEVIPPDSAPSTIADLRKYEAVVMMNVSKSSLPEGFDSLIEVYVRQLGRGLLFTGGSSTYVLGGWADTKLEAALPVDMYVKDEYELNDVAMMLLIDNSGSMDGGPLELAKQGAIKAAEIIKPRDKIGVIAFSDDAVWISPLVPGTEKESVQKKIAGIKVEGGTMVYSALNEALKALNESGSRIKNVILLTDGFPADDYMVYNTGIGQKFKDSGITVTGIGVGDSIDTNFLNHLAQATGGNVSVASDTKDLPNIILEETFKAVAQGYINNETFVPEAKDASPVLDGVKSIPALHGYMLTDSKGMAYTVLKTPDDKPVLTEWQYGLGRAVAFASDLNGKWSSSLLKSEDGLQLIRNMLSRVLPSTDTSDNGQVIITREGDKGIITAVSPDSAETDTEIKTVATVLSPSGKEETVVLVPSGIGTYQGTFFLTDEGSYVAVVNQTYADGTPVMNREGALSVKYSDEYDMFSKDMGYVAATCEQTGGSSAWTDIRDILKTPLSVSEKHRSLTVPLLIAALCLIMLDIALRRLNPDVAGLIRRRRAAAAARRAAAAAQAAAEADNTSVTANASAASAAAPAAPSAPGKEASGKEKTESYGSAPEKKKKAGSGKKESSPAPEKARAPVSSINSLLQEKDNMKRKKM